jgi:hypothetical protein
MIMRTELSSVNPCNIHQGKWAAKFTTYNGTPGSEYVSSIVSSGSVFDSEDAAYDGGLRALDALEQTGMFPDMTKPF